MLKVESLNVSYGNLQVLWDLSLDVNQGEFIALIGSNGAGKTTLLKTISGLIKPNSGSITFLGNKIQKSPPHKICEQGLIQVPEGRELFPMMSVVDNLTIGAYLHQARLELDQSLDRIFELFPILWERQKQYVGTLSGGEQQMVAIGRGLMSRPSLLMLDEPTLGLAPILVEENLKTLQRLNNEGLTILLVSQEVRQTLSIAHRAYVLENGRIHQQGPGDQLLADGRIRTAYLGL